MSKLGLSVRKGLLLLAVQLVPFALLAEQPGNRVPIRITQIAEGVWKVSAGKPETVVPTAFRAAAPRMAALNAMAGGTIPFDLSRIRVDIRPGGCTIEIPLAQQEDIYGLGLSSKYAVQTGIRKRQQTGPNDSNGKGVSHAPVPFYVSTAGYGVLVDSARFVTFSAGDTLRIDAALKRALLPQAHDVNITSESELYRARKATQAAMYIDVPVAQGIDFYVFAGPSMKQAVARYNLFSGGGVLPPLYGLGVRYIMKASHTAQKIVEMMKRLRDSGLPFDTIGLEPGWQEHSYSSTYTWSGKTFPDPEGFLAEARERHFKVDLWEQAYVDPGSPIYEALIPRSGDFQVWHGLVPDFVDPKAREIFASHHARALISKGIAGFKLDECDGSGNHRGPYAEWQFPEFAQFPSGADGEQSRMLLGRLYQQTIESAFVSAGRRTLGNARASHALAAPLPFSLYSDEYDIGDFVRYLLSSGYQGLLWAPEVRNAVSRRDFESRVGIMTFAHVMQYNAWQFAEFPWLQPDLAKNTAGQLLEDPAPYMTVVRKYNELRMSMLPYLYTAYAQYHMEGTPPIRALVLDYPDDPDTHAVDDQWMFGSGMMAAPLLPANSFARSAEVAVPGIEEWRINDVQLAPGGTSQTFQMTADMSHTGLKGVVVPLNLERGVTYVLQFRYRSTCPNLATRLTNVETTRSEVRELYKDAIRAGQDQWHSFRQEFHVDKPGRHELYLSKGWNEQVIGGVISIRDFRIIARTDGNPDDRNSRFVYLPRGDWYDFWTNAKLEGGRWIIARSADGSIPVYVKAGTLLPIAKAVQFVTRETTFEIEARVYGQGAASTLLFEDDGETLEFDRGAWNRVALKWDGRQGVIQREGRYTGPNRYTVSKWTPVQ